MSTTTYANVKFVKSEKTNGINATHFVDTYKTTDGTPFDKNIAYAIANEHPLDDCPLTDTYGDTAKIYYFHRNY